MKSLNFKLVLLHKLSKRLVSSSGAVLLLALQCKIQKHHTNRIRNIRHWVHKLILESESGESGLLAGCSTSQHLLATIQPSFDLLPLLLHLHPLPLHLPLPTFSLPPPPPYPPPPYWPSPLTTSTLATSPCLYSVFEFIRKPGVEGDRLIDTPS